MSHIGSSPLTLLFHLLVLVILNMAEVDVVFHTDVVHLFERQQILRRKLHDFRSHWWQRVHYLLIFCLARISLTGCRILLGVLIVHGWLYTLNEGVVGLKGAQV